MATYEPPTREQRGLYWIWISKASNQLDMDQDELHQAFKRLLIEDRSTESLHRVQYTQYMDQIGQFCKDNEINLT